MGRKVLTIFVNRKKSLLKSEIKVLCSRIIAFFAESQSRIIYEITGELNWKMTSEFSSELTQENDQE